MVVGLHASDHHVLWRYRLPPGALFASTPTVDSTVGLRHLAGRALRRARPQDRQAGVGPGRHRPHRVVAAPVARPGVLRLEDGNVYAMSLTTHKLVWRYHTGGAVKGAPAELDGRLVVGAYDGAVYCLNYNGS